MVLGESLSGSNPFSNSYGVVLTNYYMFKPLLCLLLLSAAAALPLEARPVLVSPSPLAAEGQSIAGATKELLLQAIFNAYILYEKDPALNARYISSVLSDSSLASGNWNAIIATNCTYPSGYAAYSSGGTWWAYWQKVNAEVPDWCYYLSRMPAQAAARYRPQTTAPAPAVGTGLTAHEQSLISLAIEKGFSIYHGSENGNAFFVSDETGKGAGGNWDVLVLNGTSQFSSYAYNLEEKWEILQGVTEFNRTYFIRKVWEA